ncbi:MAG TPA: NAD(P)/FAD-dependent oxidoreductase [Ideonella sp.]|uniref:NAD(P)/FAD-dependent oxidoreductase n=1 Tax=Ideonella sp. TaxID=1929293 RepID=UPI002E3463FD|nr:NAD(P)/FAD-dependent oxidoreductase [Ideonella sp.]HEX5684276.1 NAD(P)/FAD-dependent oxidoreductase [Ideonella sp.]
MNDLDWNQPLTALPERCEVLVVGAGPAGSACARLLAQAGHDVVLVDAQAFPRDKVCGDGLVPDTHAALRRLGVYERVMAQAHRVKAVQCVAPGGSHVDVPGELAVLPRRELDALLCAAAVEAGACMVAPARFIAPLHDESGRVIGARLGHAGATREVQCRWLVLATGATPAALLATDLCERRTPSAMALRIYVRHPGMAGEVPNLRFIWHRRLSGGYGWIFPAPGGMFNVGVGLLDSHASADNGSPRKSRNLRELFDDFLAVDPPAARLMREGEAIGELKGAPLRCDLQGAKWSAPGVLVTGEAAGATYAFTGEGIGKALETGIAAAESLLTRADSDALVVADYQKRLDGLRPRFEMYRKAASFNRYPLLVSLVVWRARHSKRMVARLSDILNERRMPGSLLSWRGFKSMMFG